MGRLDGKVALITGGARGQGAAEGKRFREEGAEVFLTDVLVDEGAKTAGELGATFIEHDVTDSAIWASIVKRIHEETGRLDVLINNAGIFQMEGLVDTGRALWDRMIAINQTGVFLGMQAVAPVMINQKAENQARQAMDSEASMPVKGSKAVNGFRTKRSAAIAPVR